MGERFGSLQIRKHLFQKIAVLHCHASGILRRFRFSRAFDHDRAFEVCVFQDLEYLSKIGLSGSKLNHDGCFSAGAVFGTKSGYVRSNSFELIDGIASCVVNDISGVVPDAEIGMVYEFDAAKDLGSVSTVRFHCDFNSLVSGVGGDFADHGAVVIYGFISARTTGEEKFQAEASCVVGEFF